MPKSVPGRLVAVVVFALLSCPASVWSFRPAMHTKTTNVAIYDALDGGICLPGLAQSEAGDSGEVWLGNTELQHVVRVEAADGTMQTEYHNYLLQYAPVIRAGSIGPDAFPDPLIGQAFTHDNYAEPHTSPTSADNAHQPPEDGMESDVDLGATLGDLFDSGSGDTALDRLKATFFGKPAWRSIDWGHEILWAAREHYQPRIAYWSSPEPPSPDLAEWWADNEDIRLARARGYEEEQRAAVAFALGYLMHMAGDGQVHAMVNEVVGLPWGYLDTRREENGYYGLLAPFAEELQHMAMESYLDSIYFPGTEPLEQRSLVDGTTCTGVVPRDDVKLACLDDEALIERPLPCDRCNPLRGSDPRGLNNRCSHCFEHCDPWNELCPPTLPDPEPGLCSTLDVCDFGSPGQLSLESVIASCGEQFSDPLEYRRCRNKAVETCTTARMSCLCDRSVDALVGAGILPKADADYLCSTTEADPDTSYAGRTIRAWAQRTGELNDLYKVFDPTMVGDRIINPNILETLDETALRGCSTAPMNTRRIYDITDPPASPGTVGVLLDNAIVDVSTAGSDIDLNDNGRPDLINECIWMNCRMYPHVCPWNALDRDVDESDYTDLRTCADMEPNPQWPTSELGEISGGACDGIGPGPTAYRPDPSQVLSGDPDAVEAFMNSTLIDVPKNFINHAFYMNRIYSDVGAAPSASGSYSLGGYPVNGVHAIVDALELLHLYLTVAIGDPWGMLQELFPNSDVVRVLSGWGNVVDRLAGFAEDTGDALYNSPVLNFTIKLPFGRTINIGIGRMLARPWYALAAVIRALGDPLGEMIRQLAGALDDEVSQRVALLEDHLRSNWVEATSCTAETITDGAHRNYSIQKYKDYADRALEIVVRGDTTCEPPSLVDWVLSGTTPSFADSVRLHKQFSDLAEWVGCRAEQLVLGEWLDRAIREPLRKMLEKASEKMFCDLLLGSNRETLTGESFAQLREHCPEIHQALWHPEEKLTESAFQTLLEGLNFNVTTSSGEETYNVREFVIRMRVVATGTCWDGSFGQIKMTERDQMRAAFYDDSVIQTQCADSITDFSFDDFVPPTGVTPRDGAEVANVIDAWVGADRAPIPVRVIDRETASLVTEERSIINSAKFEPAFNTIMLSKLALMGPGEKPGSGTCEVSSECVSPTWSSVRAGGVRELIDRGNAVATFGSGSMGFRPVDELFYQTEPLADRSMNTAAEPNADLDAFFSEQFIIPRDFASGPGQRTCADIHYNLLCNSIYSLDDPDDYCRQARAWKNPDDSFEDACLWREHDHDPCIWLENAAIEEPDRNYFPDPRNDELVCDTHGAYSREPNDHARDYTLHQRAFTVDASRLAYDSSRSSEPLHGYALTRFSLANKDTHVSRLYSKIFAPFYCPLSGPEQADQDCDGVPDACDNCPTAYNPAQVRSEIRVLGDACVEDPDRVDTRCVGPIDLGYIERPLCPGCEGLGDPDIELPPSSGCGCSSQPGEWLPWWSLFALLGLVRRGRKRARRLDEQRS